uniref:Putative RING finger protein C2F3.16 n=1 Tax=Anthurium amnicola TaxID=1678845 RepID=A0A1D1Z424_9ARAE
MGSCGDQGAEPMGKDEILLDEGCGLFGCSHYRRKCKIRAPCCNEIFDCRHCHNDAKNSLEVDPRERHEIPRHQIEMVICSLCGTEQEVQQNCELCGVCMGKYFCAECKFFDDDVRTTSQTLRMSRNINSSFVLSKATLHMFGFL